MNKQQDNDLAIRPEPANDLKDELPFWSAPFGMNLLDAVRASGVRQALDIGCGAGFPMLELAMRLGNESGVYGIDTQYSAVFHAAGKIKYYNIQNAFVTVGSAVFLPFRKSSFDLVTSNNGINNVGDPEKAIVEIGRVSRPGAQLLFTFNTNRTFLLFYETFRETLYELDLPQYNKEIDRQILEKRKPVIFMERILKSSGFQIAALKEDSFTYRFSSGTSFLNHFFIKSAFLESWHQIISPLHREMVFASIERKLNRLANQDGVLRMEVPFVLFDCVRV